MFSVSLVRSPTTHYLLYGEGYNPQWLIYNMFYRNLAPMGPCSDYTILINEVVDIHVPSSQNYE